MSEGGRVAESPCSSTERSPKWLVEHLARLTGRHEVFCLETNMNFINSINFHLHSIVMNMRNILSQKEKLVHLFPLDWISVTLYYQDVPVSLWKDSSWSKMLQHEFWQELGDIILLLLASLHWLPVKLWISRSCSSQTIKPFIYQRDHNTILGSPDPSLSSAAIGLDCWENSHHALSTSPLLSAPPPHINLLRCH